MADLQEFFYDGQIRRFITQFIRAVSHFQVEYGQDSSGSTALIQIPVLYGDPSRQASSILRDNSENSLNSVPAFAVYLTDLKYDLDRLQDPTFIDKRHVRERKWNQDTQEYEISQGNAYTVERHMPVPYTLTLKLDIWSSNTTQKLQILEQLLTIFNPAIELQNSDNYLDWTSLTAIFLKDQTWTSRSVPMGGSTDIDIATLTFELPIWITPPAKVKKLGVIHKIITSIHQSNDELDSNLLDNNKLSNNRSIISPTTHHVVLSNNKLQLFNTHGKTLLTVDDALDVNTALPEAWDTVINLYGTYAPGISEVRLLQDDGFSEIIGTITQDPTDASVMDFAIDVDTAPVNTLDPVLAIIDPTRSGPGSGLAVPAFGQRYLILGPIGDALDDEMASAWTGANGNELVADANDIVEYNGNEWIVSYDGSTDLEYVTNITTVTQYKWNGEWTQSFDNDYEAGRWRLVL